MAGSFPEERVRRPAALQRWSSLSFLHWPYDPAEIQRLLPGDLTVDTFGGRAWVGLTPFVMADVRPTLLPPVPGVSTFPETNVRTYVRDGRGLDGLWFLTLECARSATLALRTIGLPYAWAGMTVDCDRDTVRYRSRRRFPRHPDATTDVVIEVGAPLAPEEIGLFDHFLTGRWRAFSATRSTRFCTPVEHAPWPFRRAHVRHYSAPLFAACGLPEPDGEPVAHYSPGVDVRLGVPQFRSAR